MSKVLAIFGSTGQQGGGLITYILNDPELSATYKIRAITRDPTSPKALRLAQQDPSIEVVAADITDSPSLSRALAGAQTAFLVTPPSSGKPDGFETELNAARAMADAAVGAGVEYVIFSTLPPVSRISGGKYARVAAFDAKAAAEAYIRSLPVRSAFYCPGSFMENFRNPYAMLRRRREGEAEGEGDETMVLALHASPGARFPVIAAVEDTGKFVGAILAEPDRFAGERIDAAAEMLSWEEVCEAMTRVTGRKIVYRQVPVEEYRAGLPPAAADLFVEVFSYYEEFGYFGPDTEESVARGKEMARGKLTTFEEWLRAHPIEF